MSKLYFFFGTMGAGKSAYAINKAYEFRERNLEVLLALPKSLDNKFIDSRSGLKLDAVSLPDPIPFNVDILIIDEAQFLTENEVKNIRRFCTNGHSAFCYGLRTDFSGNLFEGSKYLFALSDSIRELPSMCKICQKKSIFNFRNSVNKETICLEKNIYEPLCFECFSRKIRESGSSLYD